MTQNLQSDEKMEDIDNEHCYVHTCPTQSCTKLLLTLHRAKLELECQVVHLQNELDYVNMKLMSRSDQDINNIPDKDEFEERSDPVLFYCCNKCNGLMSSREEYSKHCLSCSVDSCCKYSCIYYKCDSKNIIKKCQNNKNSGMENLDTSTVNKVTSAKMHLKKKVRKLSPERKDKTSTFNAQEVACSDPESPVKRPRREAARKLLVKWGKVTVNDVAAVGPQTAENDAATVTTENSCKVEKNTQSDAPDGAMRDLCESGNSERTGNNNSVEEHDSLKYSMFELRECDLEMKPDKISEELMNSDETDQCESKSDVSVKPEDDNDLVNAQKMMSQRVSKVMECPRIRKLVKKAKHVKEVEKKPQTGDIAPDKLKQEHLKSIYGKYLINHGTTENEFGNQVCQEMYHCPQCRFFAKKCYNFHKHMTMHDTGGSRENIKRNTQPEICTDNKEHANPDASDPEKTERMTLPVEVLTLPVEECVPSDSKKAVLSRRQIYNQLRVEWAKSFQQYAVLQNNVFQHYQCPNCSYKTTSSGHFGRHFKNVHNQAGKEGEDLWRCEICEFETQKKAIFMQHKKSHDKPYLCNYCSQRFGNQKNLADHLMIHTGEQPLQCPHCEYATKQKRCLQEHIRKHTGETLLCSSCSFTTVYQAAMTKHILSKHTKKALHPCSDCDYITNDRTNLQRHVQTHQKHKDFKCCHCNYEGVTKHDVIRHMRCHTQEKVYDCDRCEFSTAYPGALRTHLMMHLDLKPFKCSLCGYNANQKMRVSHHIQSKHSKSTAVVLDLGIKLTLDFKNFRRKPSIKREYDVFDSFDVDNQDEENMGGSTNLITENKEDFVAEVFTESSGAEATNEGLIESQTGIISYVTIVEPQISTANKIDQLCAPENTANLSSVTQNVEGNISYVSSMELPNTTVHVIEQVDRSAVPDLSSMGQVVSSVTQDVLHGLPKQIETEDVHQLTLTPVLVETATELLNDIADTNSETVNVIVDHQST